MALAGLPAATPGTSYSYGQNTSQSLGQQSSSSFIPQYSETPILESIAQYAQQMAPQVYAWGMDAYNKNQGNINNLMQQAQTYASPERIKAEMGMAEANAAQAGEKARQSSMADLQSYGIDPSSGRYAALDQANRVQTAAAVAGAGNQQRMATEQSGLGQQYQALSASMQNAQTGYGASNAMNQLLGTGMALKYSPLGQTSSGYNTSASQGTQASESMQLGAGAGAAGMYQHADRGITGNAGIAKGGYISPDLSNSHGAEVDDVPARLNAGEFVIPKDVVKWKGKEFFNKLIMQARKAHGDQATAGQQQTSGYQQGGAVPLPPLDEIMRQRSGANPNQARWGRMLDQPSYSEWQPIPSQDYSRPAPDLGRLKLWEQQIERQSAPANPSPERTWEDV